MKTYQIVPAATLAAIAAPVSALADSADGYYMHGMGAAGWIFGPLMMILMIALIAGAVVLVLRWSGVGGGDVVGRRSRALDILNERFARGEIDKSEFEERRRALAEQSGS